LVDDNKNLLKLFIANGITTVRDAGGDLTSQVIEWKKAIENEELLGPTIFTSGPKLDGPKATWAGSLVVENDTDITNALDSLAKIPTDYVKLYDSRISAEAYLNTISEAEKRGVITSGHMPFTVELDEAMNAGIDGIEHLYYIMKGCSSEEENITQQLRDKEIGFWDAMPALQSSYDDVIAANTFAKMKQKQVYSIPTLHIGKVLSYLDEVDHSKDDYLQYMGSGIIKTYEGRINRVKNSSPETIQNRKELDSFFGELAKTMSDAGVSLLAGSDSGAFNSYTYPGVSLHKELEAMVAVGISPLQALQNSAFKGSQFLKKDNDYGRLIENNIADIVLLNKNPLEDITQTKNLAYVIKGNQVLDKEDLKNLLESAVNNN
jgi:imidazolonepropionase-like amidohydrolase